MGNGKMESDDFLGRTLIHCLKDDNKRYFLNTSFIKKILILSDLNKIIEDKIKKEKENE